MIDNQPVTLAVIGAGARGTFAYAPYSKRHPNQLQVTAIAEPNEYRRRQFAALYNIPERNQFLSWQPMLEEHRADGVLVANQDADHYEPILKAMELGWNILAEKPVTNNRQEARRLLARVGEYDRVFLICHVLRYTPFFRELKKLLDRRAIGDVISVQHTENVGHFHQAHSFVRGHWRKKETSSPMILSKSCHDMDILNWLMDSECERLSSFGSLTHFRRENAPEGSPERCFDGCPVEQECPYSAYRYLEGYSPRSFHGFAKPVMDHGETGDLMEALATGPYGRCVYRCDNDVVDHQIVNLEYEDGRAVTFTMTAFSDRTDRTIRIMGTKGEILGEMKANKLEVLDFSTGAKHAISVCAPEHAHGGGDEGIIREFIRQVRNPDLGEMRQGNTQGVRGHLMAFAAEESRLSGKTIGSEEF